MNEFCNFANWQDLEQRGGHQSKIFKIHFDKEVNQWRTIMDKRVLGRSHDSVTIGQLQSRHRNDEKEG